MFETDRDFVFRMLGFEVMRFQIAGVPRKGKVKDGLSNNKPFANFNSYPASMADLVNTTKEIPDAELSGVFARFWGNPFPFLI